MSKEHNYPLRVLRRRMAKDDYKPFALDTRTGESIKVKTKSISRLALGLITAMCATLAFIAFYFIVLEPVVQTTAARMDANEIIASLGGNDKAIINKITSNHEVISRDSSSGTLTLVIATSNTSQRDVLRLAFGLSGLKEVYSDGKGVSITIISSAE